jgi:hypothetical protein
MGRFTNIFLVILLSLGRAVSCPLQSTLVLTNSHVSLLLQYFSRTNLTQSCSSKRHSMPFHAIHSSTNIYTFAYPPYLPYPYPIYASVLDALPFSCCSNFRLAAKIISSLLRCRFNCLSFLSALHALGFACSVASSSVCCSFDARLYRVIRSGWDGFAGATGLVGVGTAGRGVGTLNDGGAC